jgi:drug/metabolite transporter (DMT)-like permease
MIAHMESLDAKRHIRFTKRADHRLKGIICLCAGIAIFSIQDVIIKLVSADYPVSEAITIRSIIALPLLLLLVHLDCGLGRLRSPYAAELMVRGALNLIAYTAYYLALAALPIASCVALFFTAPLFIVTLSVTWLGEAADYRRWAAVIVGFLGVVFVMRPGSEVFDWAALLRSEPPPPTHFRRSSPGGLAKARERPS